MIVPGYRDGEHRCRPCGRVQCCGLRPASNRERSALALVAGTHRPDLLKRLEADEDKRLCQKAALVHDGLRLAGAKGGTVAAVLDDVIVLLIRRIDEVHGDTQAQIHSNRIEYPAIFLELACRYVVGHGSSPE